MTTVPTVTLTRGAVMPVIGLGTSPLDDAGTAAAVATALEQGYRLVDTAENYGNERGVGQGLRDSGVPRSEVFITSKFNKEWHSVAGARQAFERSVDKIGCDYLDLLLVHWPNPGQDRYVEAFEGLLALHADGLVRAVGTSNFSTEHLRRVLEQTGESPDVNQVQLSPYTTRADYRRYGTEHGIVTESWSPIGQGGDLLSEPVVTETAMRYGKTAAQVVLRWHLQLGLVAVPKSADPGRIAANIDIVDFALDEEEMAAVTALDRGESETPDAEAFGH